LEPDTEARADQRMIRNGLMTWAQAVRELGYDPRAQLAEIQEYNKLLDAAGIILDTDPRHTNAAGMEQPPATPKAIPGKVGGKVAPADDSEDDGADETAH
jgi:capsid protein